MAARRPPRTVAHGRPPIPRWPSGPALSGRSYHAEPTGFCIRPEHHQKTFTPRARGGGPWSSRGVVELVFFFFFFFFSSGLGESPYALSAPDRLRRRPSVFRVAGRERAAHRRNAATFSWPKLARTSILSTLAGHGSGLGGRRARARAYLSITLPGRPPSNHPYRSDAWRPRKE